MTENKYHHGDLKNALIDAGIEILTNEGAAGLSLRKVARQAGVSHAAPYSHFADKQALMAAISTKGYQMLYAEMEQSLQQFSGDPVQQLFEVSWTYVKFALQSPQHFKTTFSGLLEKKQDYPEFVTISKRSFALVVEQVKVCQEAGVLPPADSDLLAVSVWSGIHGFVCLLLENQITSSLLMRMTVKEMLAFQLQQFLVDGVNIELGSAGE